MSATAEVLTAGAPHREWLGWAAAGAVALPWLFPFTGGPSAAVWPWLASASCGCILAVLSRWTVSRPFAWLLAVCAAIPAWAWVSHLPAQPDVLYLAGAMALLALGAAVGLDRVLRDAIATGVLIAASISAVLGLLQYFGLSAHLHPWVNFAHAGEAYANLRQPNQFATLCSIGIAVLLWGALRLPRPAAMVLVGLLAAGNAASVSRTGLLQQGLLLGLSILWGGPGRRERLHLCLVGASVYVVAAWGLPALLQFLGETPARTLWGRMNGGESCSSRTVLWSNVLMLIARRPWLGWGWGELDYAHFITLYPGPRFCDILDNAHNLPLHLAVELGAPATLALCVGGIAWALRQRPWREQMPQRHLAWAIVGLVLLHSLLEYPLWYGPFQIAFGIALGWLLPQPVDRAPVRARQAVGLAVSALLLVATGAAAWDYWRVSQVYWPPEQRRQAWRQDPLEEAKRSWLFAAHARFAELTLADVRKDNAAPMAALALDMLHYSPEPRVVERVIESETLLGRDGDAVAMLARYRAAFPAEYAAWQRAQHGAGSRRPQD